MSFRPPPSWSAKAWRFAALSLLVQVPVQALEFPAGPRNNTNPGTFSGTFSQALPWSNVGQIDKASAIYLGDIGGNGKYWVLSVHHGTNSGVQPTTATFDAGTYNTVPGSMVWLTNSDASHTPVDLIVFQLAVPLPSAPTLSLQTTALTGGTDAVASDLYYVGYGGNTKRWGFNDYDHTEYHIGGPDGDGYSIVSDFDLGSSNPNEAQAFNGDSGGAAFFYDSVSHTWKVAGVMFDISGNVGQAGQLTYSLSMPDYGIKVLAAVPEPASAWLVAIGFTGIAGSWRRRRA